MAFGRDQVSLTRGDVMLDATDLQHTADVHDGVFALVRLPLFPGSGAVTRAWAAYTGQQPSPRSASHASCKARAGAVSPAASDASCPSPAASPGGYARLRLGICPVTARSVQGVAPDPGQARCLAPGCWAEGFRRLDVKGGRRPFPEETRSALDIEGKHVTIQGPSPDLTPATALHLPPLGPSFAYSKRRS